MVLEKIKEKAARLAHLREYTKGSGSDINPEESELQESGDIETARRQSLSEGSQAETKREQYKYMKGMAGEVGGQYLDPEEYKQSKEKLEQHNLQVRSAKWKSRGFKEVAIHSAETPLVHAERLQPSVAERSKGFLSNLLQGSPEQRAAKQHEREIYEKNYREGRLMAMGSKGKSMGMRSVFKGGGKQGHSGGGGGIFSLGNLGTSPRGRGKGRRERGLGLADAFAGLNTGLGTSFRHEFRPDLFALPRVKKKVGRHQRTTVVVRIEGAGTSPKKKRHRQSNRSPRSAAWWLD